jgi:hypothetical protein
MTYSYSAAQVAEAHRIKEGLLKKINAEETSLPEAERVKKAQSLAVEIHARWMCKTDLYFLGAEMLGQKNAKNRMGLSTHDDKFHGWLAKILDQDKDILVMVPRRSMKTTWVKIRIVQLILRNPKLRIGLFSAAGRLVAAELDAIKRYFESVKLQGLFPDVIPPRGKKNRGWYRDTADQLMLANPKDHDREVQENQVEVYGAGASITGKHFDYHFYDDIEDKDDITTIAQLEKLREWYSYAQAILDIGGQECMTGTPYHYADLYAQIQEEKIYDNVYIRGAMENGEPIYKVFTKKYLAREKKRMGDYIFAAQMMCNPLAREDQLFPPPQPTYEKLPGGKDTYVWYMTVDPAATTRTYSDETAFCIAAVNQHGWLFIEECFGVKKPGNETAEILLNFNDQFSFRKIGVEFGLQEHLRHIIDLLRKQRESAQGRKIKLPIEPVPIKRVDKYQRFNYTLGSYVRQGKCQINVRCTSLLQQMEYINPNYTGKDDLVDAVSMMFPTVETFPHGGGANAWNFEKTTLTIETLFPKKTSVAYDERFTS